MAALYRSSEITKFIYLSEVEMDGEKDLFLFLLLFQNCLDYLHMYNIVQYISTSVQD